MCDFFKWFFEGRLTEWISAVGALISGYIAYKVYILDKKVSEASKPRVSIWHSVDFQDFDGILGVLTFINLGKESLPTREIAFVYDSPEKRIDSILVENISSTPSLGVIYESSQSDLIFETNKPVKVLLRSQKDWPTQFKIRVMYYDGSFEFIDIDTSNLGGKYVLTGKGKRYGK